MSDTHLRYFYEAAKFGSMRAAAEKLGVAVSSISRQIAQLEAEMGVSLIEHGRRTIKLTEAGELTVLYYRERLDQKEAFETRLVDLKRLRIGRIELAIAEDLVSVSMSAVLARFMAKYAGLSLVVRTAGSEELLRMVVEDEVHLGVVLHAEEDPRLRARVSIPAPLMAIMEPRHSLAAHRSVRLADLAPHPLCLMESSLHIRQIIKTAEKRDCIQLEPGLTTNSTMLLKDMICCGPFVTVLPELTVSREIERGELIAISIDNPILNSTAVNLVSRVGRQLPIAAGRLLTVLETHFNSWLRPYEGRRAS
jgi:DNA-binding transcriptional LysR family regulator